LDLQIALYTLLVFDDVMASTQEKASRGEASHDTRKRTDWAARTE
jgi:hypothetical protein